MLCLIKQQSGWSSWKQTLGAAAKEGQLIICPVAFAESSLGFSSWVQVLEKFQALHIHYDPIGPDSAFLAGEIFQAYRKNKGPRDHLLPDFLIAAHARCQADRLATLDRGYLRTYFPDLPLLTLP
jgi:predicted nucleic acid-binding protein